MMKELPFKVDMAGVLEILGGSLYSRRDTAIREILQNAHDAIVRRRATDLTFHGAIRIHQDEAGRELSIEDDGVGLTADEAETYLGTLGAGISGLLKKGSAQGQDGTGIIGQFGVGLLSSFLLAKTVVVESRKDGEPHGVRWEAGAGSSIKISFVERAKTGTKVTLSLRDDALEWSKDPKVVEEAVRFYADFLPVPIYLGASTRRMNVVNASWFEPTPDPETVALELEQRFDDAPLDVILIRQTRPTTIQGALYVTRQRTPGFSGRPLVTATVRRMVISPRLDGLLPEWGAFYRGVLELPELLPTTSREDLVRDARFERVREELERILLERLAELAKTDSVKLQAILTWHAYSFTGAALSVPRLRAFLRENYRFTTSQGPLTFDDVVRRSKKDASFVGGEDAVVWYNTDRRQEQWTASVFEGREAPCIQALHVFEGSLLTAMAQDAREAGTDVRVRVASPRDESFVQDVLKLGELDRLPEAWEKFFEVFSGVRFAKDSLESPLPVLAFLNEHSELRRDLEALKKQGTIPSAFSRIIDRSLGGEPEPHLVILNARHRIVARALEGNVHSPLASVLRVLVSHALAQAGIAPRSDEQKRLLEDLDWIAETVAPGKKESTT